MAKLNKYAHSFELGGITEFEQEKLLQARVLVMGAGSLGSGVIMNLASLGIGQIKIVDDGIVTSDNFNGQLIHKEKNIGRAKVISAKDWIQEYNSDIKVELDKIRLNEINYYNVIQGYDIMIDCFDSYQSKYILNDIATRHNMILIHGSTQGHCGQVTTIIPRQSGCLNCIMPKPAVIKDENYATLSPVVSTISALQAQEVLKIVLSKGEPLLNRLLVFDAFETKFKTLNYTKNISCECCSGGIF